jgi:RimJ/RimL family protein N-acetyltransferase
MEAIEVRLHLLEGGQVEMDDLQRVFEEAPDFARRVTGLLPGQSEAQSMYSMLPEGKLYDDKFVYGIYFDRKMVGCIDVIRDFPTKETAWIGLFMISEKYQRRGVGIAAFNILRNYIEKWPNCERVGLAVVSTNDVALPFWRKVGFQETGKRTPYKYDRIEAESIFMELELY